METTENPFIVSGSIDPEYFCDRRDESARLIKSLTNGNNVVLMSPRRMGKTGLIQFCYGKPSGVHSGRDFYMPAGSREAVHSGDRRISTSSQIS